MNPPQRPHQQAGFSNQAPQDSRPPLPNKPPSLPPSQNMGNGQHASQGHAHPQHPYGTSAPMNQAPDKNTMIICCILSFFTVGGIQRFVSGHIGLGILHVFTGGLCLIGTIYDLVKISNGSYLDSKGRALRQDGSSLL